MSEQVRALLTQILALPPEERALLVEAVHMSFEPSKDVEAAWAAEIRRRREGMLAGTEEVMDWAEARKLIWGSRPRRT